MSLKTTKNTIYTEGPSTSNVGNFPKFDTTHPTSNHAFFRVSINENDTTKAKAAAIVET